MILLAIVKGGGELGNASGFPFTIPFLFAACSAWKTESESVK